MPTGVGVSREGGKQNRAPTDGEQEMEASVLKNFVLLLVKWCSSESRAKNEELIVAVAAVVDIKITKIHPQILPQ